MHDVGVPLDHHEVGNPDRSVAGDPPHVVPPQVHQHPVLRQLLLVGLELLSQSSVLLGRSASGPGTGDGPNRHRPVLHPDQHLGRAAHQRHLVQLQVVEVGGRVEGSERPIEIEGRGIELHPQALAENHLKGVPGLDVLPNRLHAPLELLPGGGAGEVRIGVGLRGKGQGGGGGSLGQRLDDAVDLLHRRIVHLPKLGFGCVTPELGRRDGSGPSEQVVDGDDHIGEDEEGVGKLQIVGGLIGEMLDLAHHIVPEVPYGTSPEAREVGGRRGHPLPEAGVEVGQGIVAPDGLPALAGRPPFGHVASEPPGRGGLGTQEGVAGPLLSSHHGLQEEAEGRLGQLRVGGNRRVGVEKKLAPDGHYVGVAGLSEKIGKRREETHS